MVNDGVCNPECFYESCSWDGMDCDLPDICSPGCFREMVGDKVCSECNNEACNFDQGDCCGCPIEGCT